VWRRGEGDGPLWLLGGSLPPVPPGALRWRWSGPHVGCKGWGSPAAVACPCLALWGSGWQWPTPPASSIGTAVGMASSSGYCVRARKQGELKWAEAHSLSVPCSSKCCCELNCCAPVAIVSIFFLNTNYAYSDFICILLSTLPRFNFFGSSLSLLLHFCLILILSTL